MSMRTEQWWLRGVAAGSAFVAALAFAPLASHASCDVIPGARQAFRGALGSVNRPFAIPGQIAELLTLTRGACDTQPLGGFGGDSAEDALFVTLIFEPPGPGLPSAVVLHTNTGANAQACQSKAAACRTRLGGGQAKVDCRGVAGGSLDYDIVSAAQLRFRFPDTDDLVGEGVPGATDDHTLVGPASIAVTTAAAELPCALAAEQCRTCVVDPSVCGLSTGELLACIDEFYPRDGTCANDPVTTGVDPVFPHFTALPPANDFRALCSVGGPCQPTTSEARFAVDVDGNALVPVDWRGVLVATERVPVPRLVRAITDLPAFSGFPTPVRVPGRAFLSSFSPGGHRLPPIFEPLSDPSQDLSLFGSTDAPVGVVRVARRSPALEQCSLDSSIPNFPCTEDADCPGGACVPSPTASCSGGARAGRTCTRDSECPDGSCPLPSLFDFSDRLADDGIGPVVIASPTNVLDLRAEEPVSLEGIVESQGLFAFVTSEAIEDVTLNDDLDATDPVLRLHDRRTGDALPIGTNGAEARAAARVREPPFSYPAVAAEGAIAAFLEPEPLEGECTTKTACDSNGDGDVFDTILRLYRIQGPAGSAVATDLLPDLNLAVDAAPLVNGRSVVISNGLVFFRRPEWAGMRQKTTVVSLEPDDTQPGTGSGLTGSGAPSLSDDGSRVAFATHLGLDPDDTGISFDVYLRDRDAGATLLLNRNEGGAVRGPALDPSITGAGDLVVFESQNSSLVSNDSNGVQDVFLWDSTAAPMIERLSVWGADGEANGVSRDGRISSDGTRVIFESQATNLHPDDATPGRDLFLRELATTPATALVTPDESDVDETPAISADGSSVAFRSSSANLVSGDTNETEDVFCSDVGGAIERCSEGARGEEAIGPSSFPAISGDGRFVAFRSAASNLVAGDTNGVNDVFVRDRVTGIVERVSVASDGSQGGFSAMGAAPALSDDGRYVVFASAAQELVLAGQSGKNDVFVHDRLTGLTSLVSVLATDCPVRDPVGDCAQSQSRYPALTRDARFAGFRATADFVADELDGSLGVADANGQEDILVRGPERSDPTAAAANDFHLDQVLDDVVLQVVDTNAPSPEPVTLDPAKDVVVVNGDAAFLRPDGSSFSVFLSTNGAPPQPLNQEGTALAMSERLIAVLAPTGVGDQTVVEVCDRATGCLAWTPLGSPATALQVAGTAVALLTEGGVIELFDLDDPPPQQQLIVPTQKAEDFVLGEKLLAFRTREAEQGANLNASAPDSDLADDVLRVYDLESKQLLTEPEQAVIPCPFEACDPRLPYRVDSDTVTFLTPEADQGAQDLNGDEDATDLVKQVFNARKAARSTGPLALLAAAPGAPASVDVIASASGGLCTETGAACFEDADCGVNGDCFVPPGRCILDTGTACDPSICSDTPTAPGCGCSAEQFCVESGPTTGSCHEDRGECVDRGCPDAGAECRDTGDDTNKLLSPIGESGATDLLVTSGVCIEILGTPCVDDLGCGGDTCGAGNTCERRHEACTLDADCPVGSCAPKLLVVGAADSDGDGTADPHDNCSLVGNADQADSDADGVGDVCGRCTSGPDTDGDGIHDACECGDISGDGLVNTADARLIQRCAVGEPLSVCSSLLCDASGDGRCNTGDARLVQRLAVGSLTKANLSCSSRPR